MPAFFRFHRLVFPILALALFLPGILFSSARAEEPTQPGLSVTGVRENAASPPLPASDPGGWSFSDFISLAALLLALALMLLATRWTRRPAFFRSQGREMRLLDRLAIGRQSTLLLIQLRGREYWLADHPGGVTLLAELPLEKDAADSATSPLGKSLTASALAGKNKIVEQLKK
jgi:flagellar biogenesis protein FliO